MYALVLLYWLWREMLIEICDVNASSHLFNGHRIVAVDTNNNNGLFVLAAKKLD